MHEYYDKKKHRVPVKIWAETVEPGAMDQLDALAAMPYVHHHVAAMPDVHQGYGATIGSVFGAVDALVPSAVGVDIGCGMAAVETSLDAQRFSREDREAITQCIYKTVPVGFGRHDKKQHWEGFDYESPTAELNQAIQEEGSVKLGTLGGGNHFIELQSGPDGRLWVMIHSGSRRAGYLIADYYVKLAARLSKARNAKEGAGLESLPLDTEEGQAYLADMQWAQRYALVNRERMIDAVLNVIQDYLGDPDGIAAKPAINIHHNYAAEEEHFGRKVWVHRKGATFAGRGTMGIVPGSMGTRSYIVEGLGSADSFTSCSHGAGRVMSRKQAKKTLDLDEVKASMGDVVAPVNRKTLDEAPQAYKKIEDVMRQQRDLVEPRVELRPLAVVKGSGE